jgi:hypothetical protein
MLYYKYNKQLTRGKKMIEELKEITMVYLPFAIVLMVALVILFLASIPAISKWLIKTDLYLSTKKGGKK